MKGAAPAAGVATERALAEAVAAEDTWLQAELAALGPEPDAAALAAFEARCEQRHQASRAESDRLLAEIERDYQEALRKNATPAAPVLRGAAAVVVLVLLAWMIGGLLLEVTIGSVFFFNHDAAYSSAQPWMFLASLLPLGWGLGHLIRRQKDRRYPTWAVRWLVFFPFAVAMCAGAFVAAPLGWAALAGWVVGTPVEMEAKVMSVGTRSRSAGCRQKGRLRIAGNEANVCFSMLAAEDRMPRAGDVVRLSGRSSGLGVFVRELRGRQAP